MSRRGHVMNSRSLATPAKVDPKEAHLLTQFPTGGPLTCCRFDPQGRFLFCGLERSAFERFDLTDGKKVSFAGGHDSWVFSLAVSANGETIFSGGGDGRIVVWPCGSSSPKPTRTIDAHKGWIRALAISQDGSVLASAGNDRVVRLWNPISGAMIRECSGHLGHVYSLQIHPNGKTLLSGDLLGKIHEWDLASGRLVGSYDAKPLHIYESNQKVDFGGVRGLTVSPDGKFIAAGGLHKATNPLGMVHEPIVIIFDSVTRKPIRTLLADKIASGVIWSIRYLADESVMAVCGGIDGGFLLFWKAGVDKDYHRVKLPSLAREMDLHPDGLRVATAHHDSNARITRLAAGTA
jgi:WD40 repeat protein